MQFIEETITADGTLSVPGNHAFWARVEVKATTYPDGGLNLTQNGIALDADLTGISADTVKAVMLKPGALAFASSDWTNVDGLSVEFYPTRT